MIKFEELVEGLLIENEETPAIPSSDDSDEAIKASSNDLKGIFSKNYGIISKSITDSFEIYFKNGLGQFPSQSDFGSIVYTAAENSLRNNKKYSYPSPIETIFPLLDLIAIAKDAYKNAKSDSSLLGKTAKQTETQSAIDGFIKNLNKWSDVNKAAFPLSYPAISGWAQELRTAALQAKGALNIGEMKLNLKDSVLQTKNFYELLKSLLEDTRIAKTKLLSKTITLGNADSTIKQIVENPTQYFKPDQVIFPDKKLKAIYSTNAVSNILSIAIRAEELFKSQYLQKTQKPLIGVSSEANKPMLWDFWNNKIQWESSQPAPQTPPATEAQPTTLQNTSFDQRFELLYRQMLSEVTDPAIISRVKANVGRSAAARKTSKFGPLKPTAPKDNPSQPENNESPTVNNFPDNQYTLATLVKAKDNKLPEAIALYNAFELLANYLKTEAAQFDWMGKISKGLSKAASGAEGLMFGVKIPGM